MYIYIYIYQLIKHCNLPNNNNKRTTNNPIVEKAKYKSHYWSANFMPVAPAAPACTIPPTPPLHLHNMAATAMKRQISNVSNDEKF